MVFALRTFSYSQLSDQAFWLSLASFYEKGVPLYRGAFDIKDPLFFWTMTGAYSAIGRAGPFLLDLIYLPVTVICSYFVAIKLNFSRVISFISSIIFLLALTGTYYETFRTTLAGIMLIVISMYLATQSKQWLLGITLGMLFFYKLPYFGIGVIAIFLLPITTFSTKFLALCIARVAAGMLTVATPIVLLLWVNNEFVPYLGSIRENITYSQNYTGTIEGRQPGIAGHLQVFLDQQISPKWFFICILVLILLALVFRTQYSFQTWFTFTAIIFVVLAFLLLTAMWSHHFHILSILIWLIVLLSISNITMISQGKVDVLRMICIGLLFILTLSVGLASGVTIPLKSKSQFSEIISPVWSEPKEVSVLEKIQKISKLPPTFARLGTIDDSALGTFLDPNWNLVCSRYAIGGLESDEILNQTFDCLRADANYVVVSDLFYSLEWTGGKYDYIRAKTKEILDKYFICTNVEVNSSAQVCYRNS